MAWKEVLDSEMEGRDPVLFLKKLRDRDEANAERIVDFEVGLYGTSNTVWTDVSSIPIRVHSALKKLFIRGVLYNEIIGVSTTGTVYIRFRVGTTYSTEDSLFNGAEQTLNKDPFSCEIDLSALSGNQTLYMQGKIVKSGTGSVVMKGKILTEADNNRRYDSYWKRV